MERYLPWVWIAIGLAIATLALVYADSIAWDPLLLSLQIASLAMIASLVLGTAFALLLALEAAAGARPRRRDRLGAARAAADRARLLPARRARPATA